MQRSLCRVKGQNQWSVLSSNCSAPPHPHNFEELGKNWEVAESASERESLQLLRSGVERSILSFSCFTFLAHIQFYFSFFFFFFLSFIIIIIIIPFFFLSFFLLLFLLQCSIASSRPDVCPPLPPSGCAHGSGAVGLEP